MMEDEMSSRRALALLFAALLAPMAALAQAPGPAAGAAVTIAGVAAIAVNRPGTVTTAVRPDFSAFWSRFLRLTPLPARH